MFKTVINLCCCLAIGLLTTIASADDFEWTGAGSNGLWNDAANWINTTPGGTDSDGIPDSNDNATFPMNAQVAGGSAFGLNINSDVEVVFGAAATNTFTLSNGLSSKGILSFAADNGGSSLIGPDQRILIDSEITLAGGGSINFNGIETGIVSSSDVTLTNQDHTIRGPGSIFGFSSDLTLVNQDTIIAENGTLALENAFVDNSGVIEIASDGFLSLFNSEIAGGTIDGMPQVETSGQLVGSTFRDLTLTGSINVGANATGTAVFAGNINNQASLNMRVDNGGSSLIGPDQRILIDSEATLTGGGSINFNGIETGIVSTSDATLTNQDHTIRGPGSIFGFSSDLTLVNQDTIIAENGVLTLENTFVDNSGVIEIASDGFLSLNNSEIAGGTIDGMPQVETSGQLVGSTFRDLTLTGSINVGANATGTAVFAGNINNQASLNMRVDNGGSSLIGPDQRILIDSEVALTGGGSINLNGNETGIVSTEDGILVNEDNVIRGNGIVAAVVDNRGTLFADNSVGDLIFQNLVTLRSDSVLAVELNGFNFAQTSELVFDFPLNINGTLKLVAGNNFAAIVGTTQRILTTPSLGGAAEFPEIDISMAQTQTEGFEFNIIYEPTAVSIEVNDIYTRGDINTDGLLTLLDVEPFVELIINGGSQREGDLNGDGSVDLLDVAPFVSLLLGG